MTFNEYSDTYLQLMPFEIQEIIITYVNKVIFRCFEHYHVNYQMMFLEI